MYLWFCISAETKENCSYVILFFPLFNFYSFISLQFLSSKCNNNGYVFILFPLLLDCFFHCLQSSYLGRILRVRGILFPGIIFHADVTYTPCGTQDPFSVQFLPPFLPPYWFGKKFETPCSFFSPPYRLVLMEQRHGPEMGFSCHGSLTLGVAWASITYSRCCCSFLPEKQFFFVIFLFHLFICVDTIRHE